MAKQDGVMGIYAAHGRLSLAVKQGKGYKTAWVDIPTNIVQSGEIVSRNLFAQFIKETMKENKIRAKKAAFVIGSDKVLMKNVNMPLMDEEQIRYNIPFEFRDYIRGELKEYLYDFAYKPPVGDGKEQTDGADKNISLLAVAIPAEFFEELTETMNLAGLKMVKALPDICVIESILKLYPTEEERLKERCFLDLGVNKSRMQIYKDGRYKLSHVIDIGESHIIRTIADEMNVDMELARTYMRTSYQDCVALPSVMNAYKDISLEVLKGFNFYEMSDMSSRLNEVVLYGSGAMIEPLTTILKERIGMNVLTMNETFPEYNLSGDLNITASSIGALLD